MNLFARPLVGRVSTLPPEWRAPVLHLAGAQPIRLLAVVCGAAVLLTMLTAEDRILAAPFPFVIAGWVLGIGLGGGAFGAVRQREVWITLFQRPVSPTAHLLRVVVLGLLALVAAALLGALLFLPFFLPALHELDRLARSVAALLLTGAVLFSVAVGASALSARRGAWIFVLLLVVSIMQPALLIGLGVWEVEWVRLTLEWLLIPVDALQEATVRLFQGESEHWRPRHALQLVVYPLAWLAVAAAQARRYGEGDLPAGD